MIQRAAVEGNGPDVVVTDIEMPRMTGLELAQRIRERATDCKVAEVPDSDCFTATYYESGLTRRFRRGLDFRLLIVI